MKKLFNETKITWIFLVLFSVLLGITVGILNKIPLLNNTSFQDIAIWLDMWIVLAIFIINNCHSNKEAIIKCFVFFLISQPLIYLTEVLINVLFFNHAFVSDLVLYFKNYYWGAGWLKWTILTIPGSFIAYQIKKDNILSSLVLAVATCFLAFVGVKGLINCFFNNFPYHLINSIICIVMSLYLVLIILKTKKTRLLTLILTILAMIISVILTVYDMNTAVKTMLTEDFINRTIMVDYIVDNPEIVDVSLSQDGDYMIASSLKIGETQVHFFDKEGNEYIYIMSVSSDKFDIIYKK